MDNQKTEVKNLWVTVCDASSRLEVSYQTICNWVRAGKISSEKRDGRRLIYWPSVEKAIAERPALGRKGRPSKLSAYCQARETAKPSEPLDVRIDSRVTKETNGCWIWTGGAHGEVPFYSAHVHERINIRDWMYHRTTGLTGGRLSPGCGRSSCVNPAHQVRSNGDIPLLEVPKIRARWALHLAHGTSLPRIAKEYGVSRQRIEQVVRDVEPQSCQCGKDAQP